LPLHTVPSAHDVPFGAGGWRHPATASHESSVQGFASPHESGVPAVHVPLWHVSAPLHTVPSGHGVPFDTGTWTQPVSGLQESAVQTFPSSHASGIPGVQAPDWHVSLPLQTDASPHDVPSGTAAFTQPVTALQLSFVHTLPSSQASGVPGTQAPP